MTTSPFLIRASHRRVSVGDRGSLDGSARRQTPLTNGEHGKKFQRNGEVACCLTRSEEKPLMSGSPVRLRLSGLTLPLGESAHSMCRAVRLDDKGARSVEDAIIDSDFAVPFNGQSYG
jgi:hypothetical protein